MKKTIIMAALFGVASFTMADYAVSFTNGTSTADGVSNETSIAWNVNTSGGSISTSTSSDDTAFNSWVGLTGSGTLNDSFTLTMTAGFNFNNTSPSYDTTAHSDPAKNTIRFRMNSGTAEGLAPLGSGSGFSGNETEILHFTIAGLDAGQSFKLNGFTLKDNGADRIDLYYGAGVTKYDTAGTPADVSGESIILENGDQFGFAYDRTGGNRSALEGITFDVIPEPATLGLVVAMGSGILFIRRRFLI